MKVAVYPGSFNPFHRGHLDIVKKALRLFDKVIIARGINPEKDEQEYSLTFSNSTIYKKLYDLKKLHGDDSLGFDRFGGLFANYIKEFKAEAEAEAEDLSVNFAIIKGLRNGYDLEDEKAQLYWNEDLGITIPFFYIISDRNNCHISSSSIRGLDKFKESKR